MNTPMVLACLPTDRGLILGLWEKTGLPIEQCPQPTDLYTLGNCAYCQRSIWVGPRQLKMNKEEGLETWCYFCAGANFDLENNMVDLGGGAQVEGVSRW